MHQLENVSLQLTFSNDASARSWSTHGCKTFPADVRQCQMVDDKGLVGLGGDELRGVFEITRREHSSYSRPPQESCAENWAARV
jgi:hypothetical protein